MIAISKNEWQELCLSMMDHHALFYKIGEMGKPFLTETIPTACVVFDKTGEYINFLFNPEFWKTSSLYQKTFVICHEALHLILNHGKRFKDSDNPKRSNIAMDIVVNHALVNRFGFVRENVECWQELCWVDTVFKDKKINGFEIPNDDTAEYYLNILNKTHPNDEDLNQFDSVDLHDFLDGDNKELFDKLNKELSDEEKATIKKFYEKHSDNQKAGTAKGDQIHFAQKNDLKLKKKWETVIVKWTKKFMINTDCDMEQWARKHRRFTMLGESLFLPSDMEIEELNMENSRVPVHFYLDTSGSCWHLKDRFFNAAESLPSSRFDVKLFCFDTSVTETSLESRKIFGGGGTSFQIIERHIQQNLNNGEYPTVFVMTDGWGDQVRPQKPQNWHWFIDTPNPKSLNNIVSNYIPSESKVFLLSDFI